MKPFPRQQQRLLFSFGVSVLLHFLLLGAGEIRRMISPPPQLPASVLLQARLRPPNDTEPLLKDTLSEAQFARPDSPDRTRPGTEATLRGRERALQRKLAEHLFYPPEAVAGNMEGEVRLLLTLNPQGRVVEARIASSSGWPLLDQAAMDAAYAMRQIPAAGMNELILPVVFKLQ